MHSRLTYTKFSSSVHLYREHYMPVRGYEFYLVRYRVEHEKIKFVSTSGHVINVYYINNNLKTI